MKYKAKIYAEALVSVLLEKERDYKKISNNFFEILQKNGDLKKAREIMLLAEIIFHKKTGKRKIILETARKIQRKNILKDFFQEGDLVQEKINPELIAGIKIIINNESQLDFSLKNKLQQIFQ